MRGSWPASADDRLFSRRRLKARGAAERHLMSEQAERDTESNGTMTIRTSDYVVSDRSWQRDQGRGAHGMVEGGRRQGGVHVTRGPMSCRVLARRGGGRLRMVNEEVLQFAATGESGVSVCCAGGGKEPLPRIFGVHHGERPRWYQDSRSEYRIYLNDWPTGNSYEFRYGGNIDPTTLKRARLRGGRAGIFWRALQSGSTKLSKERALAHG